jgi:fido (protein-threonine AMPylation protein)
MYAADDDPYCYAGTSVLKNRLDLRTQAELDEFEAAITAQRADEPLPAGNLDRAHYCAINHHLFQDVAAQAGHPLNLERLHPPDMMQAMVASFGGDERPLANLILTLLRDR